MQQPRHSHVSEEETLAPACTLDVHHDRSRGIKIVVPNIRAHGLAVPAFMLPA